jgi:DNA-binding transcriptional LysR family regulator
LPLSADRYEMLDLSSETLAPYAKAGPDGQPCCACPGRPGERVPFLGYASGAYMGRLVDVILKQAGEPLHLDPIYETDMAEGLKAMALEGHGLAFLPHSSVRKELRRRAAWWRRRRPASSLTMEVRIYRERPESARHVKPGVQALVGVWALGADPRSSRRPTSNRGGTGLAQPGLSACLAPLQVGGRAFSRVLAAALF